jgi:tripartite-type tricarboxylate transporter receptor subunit TctC
MPGPHRWLLENVMPRVLSIGFAFAATAASAAYPDKPVKLIVPFAPGGGTDLIARVLAAGMSRELGQQVIIDNRPGAGTIIGTDMVAKSPPDGYTIVIATFAHAVNPSLVAKLPYAHGKAFAPIALVGKGPNVLVVRTDSPYRSAHLAGEMLNNLAKVELLHVPYRGAGPAINDLLGGQVDMIFGTASAVSMFVESGKLRALGVTTAGASDAFKGVPPISETVPGYQVESWYGLYAPAGTPAEVINKLNAAAAKAAHGPEFAKKVQHEGVAVIASDPAELDRYVKAEEVRWQKVVKENNIKAD